MTEMNDHDKQQAYKEFGDYVNMPPKELEEWLSTRESQSVGVSENGDESIGHASGRRIVTIKRTKKAELSEDQYEHMRKVVGYIKRHTAQRPAGELEHTRWRYSLMNWGHDPLK